MASDSERMDALGRFASFTAAELSEMAFTSVRTARRWLREGRAPRLVMRWLDFTRSGDLGALNAAWKGWSLRRDGRLHVNSEQLGGYAWTPGDVAAMVFHCINASTGRAEIERLERELAELKQQLQQQKETRPAAKLIRVPCHRRRRLERVILPDLVSR